MPNEVSSMNGEQRGNFESAETGRKAAEKTYGAPTELRAGARREIAIEGMTIAFRYCPAGEFMMGSPDDEDERSYDEFQHKAILTRGFWLMETPATQALWKSVMGDNPSKFKGDDRPVENVSWEDCQVFIGKLNAAISLSPGEKFRLPTEAEWEYACRAGASDPFGGSDIDDICWYRANSGKQTQPVGRKAPNAWGLCDMRGNVLEWCSDWYDEDYYFESPTEDPTGPSSTSDRVLRGGCWSYYAGLCRAAYRNCHDPSGRGDGIGFRLALSSSR